MAGRCRPPVVGCPDHGVRTRCLATLGVSLSAVWVSSTHGAIHPACAAIEQAFARNQPDVLAAVEASAPHWEALKQFRLASLFIQESNKRAARRSVDRGLQAVRAGLKAKPGDPELLLLGAMLDGEHVLVRRWSFFTNGVRGLRRLRRAERAMPDNPRARLIRGSARVVMPRVLGGDALEAIDILSPAVRSNATCADGDWGQVDVLTWLGRAADETGDRAAAQDYYRRALAYSPGNYWVQKAMTGRGYVWQEAR